MLLTINIKLFCDFFLNDLVEDMDLRQMNRGRVMDQDLRQPPIQMPVTQPLPSVPVVESSIPPPLP